MTVSPCVMRIRGARPTKEVRVRARRRVCAGSLYFLPNSSVPAQNLTSLARASDQSCEIIKTSAIKYVRECCNAQNDNFSLRTSSQGRLLSKFVSLDWRGRLFFHLERISFRLHKLSPKKQKIESTDQTNVQGRKKRIDK